jgi:hypothetical protein
LQKKSIFRFQEIPSVVGEIGKRPSVNLIYPKPEVKARAFAFSPTTKGGLLKYINLRTFQGLIRKYLLIGA